MSESQSPQDDDDSDELKQALAAFGEGALDLFDEDDDLFAEMGDELSDSQDDDDVQIPETVETSAPEFQACSIADSDSKLLQYTKELVNAIYGGVSMPRSGSEHSALADTNRCIAFSAGQQTFAIPLEHACEIIRHPKISELPRTPSWLRGVTNVRGQIISITDLRYLCGLPSESQDVREKAIVVRSEEKNKLTAIVADRVHGIRSLGDLQNDLSDLAPDVVSIAKAVETTGEETIVLIDIEKLFNSADLAAFKTAE